MNNEEKNLTPEAEGAEQENNVTETANTSNQNKLSGGVLAAIIGGAAVIIIAIILMIVLIPGNNGDNPNQGNDGGESDVGDNTETKVTYTVTVVDEDGNPVNKAMVNIYPKGGTSFFMPTDANGKVSYRTDKEMQASILSLPTGYEYDKINTKLNFDDDGNLTITVRKQAPQGTEYLIRVVDQNGNVVVGARVQICEDSDEGSCLMPVTTDENGEAIYIVEEKSYKATINSLPEGYEKISDGYVYFEDGVAVIKVNKK